MQFTKEKVCNMEIIYEVFGLNEKKKLVKMYQYRLRRSFLLKHEYIKISSSRVHRPD